MICLVLLTALSCNANNIPSGSNREVPRTIINNLDNNDEAMNSIPTNPPSTPVNLAKTPEDKVGRNKTSSYHNLHSASLPLHKRILNGDLNFLSDETFWLRLMVVASLAVVVGMILLLLSNSGRKSQFRGYRVTSFNDKDFLPLDEEDDDEVSLFDAGNHKLLSKSREII